MDALLGHIDRISLTCSKLVDLWRRCLNQLLRDLRQPASHITHQLPAPSQISSWSARMHIMYLYMYEKFPTKLIYMLCTIVHFPIRCTILRSSLTKHTGWSNLWNGTNSEAFSFELCDNILGKLINVNLPQCRHGSLRHRGLSRMRLSRAYRCTRQS